ncbi:hypothetical protein HNV12_02590 [Methanococcoides sp. SA1]|nr:hypothetical protein [Methanococcoides sp. SA1]
MALGEDYRKVKSSLVDIYRLEGKRYEAGILQIDLEGCQAGKAVLYRDAEEKEKLVIKRPIKEDSKLVFETISENASKEYIAKIN